MNLIINARDAMPEGGRIEVAIDELRAGRDDDPLELPPGHYVRIRVTDQGKGIPGETRRPRHRALLHHQGGRQGHRPRPVDGGRLRPAVGRQAQDRQHSPGEGTTIELFLPSTPLPAPAMDEVSSTGQLEADWDGEGGAAGR